MMDGNVRQKGRGESPVPERRSFGAAEGQWVDCFRGRPDEFHEYMSMEEGQVKGDTDPQYLIQNTWRRNDVAFRIFQQF